MKIGHVDNYYKELSRTELTLRRLLWLRHGHDGLYGDDGEMQCGHCRLDFLRNTALVIEESFERQSLELMKGIERPEENMTEPKTVDEIMGLAKRFADCHISGYRDAEIAIRDAITALAAERDQAVSAKDLLERAMQDVRAAQVREVLERDALKAERDQAVKEYNELLIDRNHVITEYEKVLRERDAIQSRVAELEKAIGKSWAHDDGDWTTCSHCHAGGWGGPVHEPGCIVRTIEGKV